MHSNWGFGEDSWESFRQQGDQTSQSQENQPWIFIERTDAEAEAPILWPPDIKSQLIWKDPDARKDWSQEKGMTEEEMVGWHHWLSGHGKSRWRGRYYLKTLSWSAYGPLFSESMTLCTPGWVDWQFSLRSPKSGSTGCLSRKKQWSRSRLFKLCGEGAITFVMKINIINKITK